MSQNASEGRRCDEAEQRNRDKCEMVEVTVQADDSSLAHVRYNIRQLQSVQIAAVCCFPALMRFVLLLS